MNGVTKEQIAQARQVGILAYMQAHEPEELVRVGTQEYKTRTHDSLRISLNGKWNWCSRGFGGANALNYLIQVKGMDFISAVQELCNEEPAISVPYSTFVWRGSQAPTRRKFDAPAPDKDNTAALAYLRRRGICDSVLGFCIEHKILYQTDKHGYKNCVFVGKDSESVPRYACMRGCSGNFRGDTTGSQKMYGFSIPARDPENARVEVYEAPVDALSGASLRILAGRDWRTIHYLSLGGLNYDALDHFLNEHQTITTIHLCLDNDEPGRTFTKKLMEHYGGRNITIRDLPPPKGKDYNEYLQQRIKEKSRDVR